MKSKSVQKNVNIIEWKDTYAERIQRKNLRMLRDKKVDFFMGDRKSVKST